MYFYAPPFIIVKETGYYNILDQLGGKYHLDRDTLIVALHALGKESTINLSDSLATDYTIKNANDRLRSLLDNEIITLTQHKRKDSFNYVKVLERIITD